MVKLSEVSLYFHIPFCTHKCAYCHFYVLPDKESDKQKLLHGLQLEWQQALPYLLDKQITTIYFGGGTPSLFGAERVAELLSWIQTTHPLDVQKSEITLEVNPENVTQKLINSYAEAGINRISMGIQSLDPSLLKLLTRTHSAEKAMESVYVTAEAGISNISVDLMYDLPNQTISHWENTLEQVVKLPIKHLSLYNLTIEPHTVFFKKRELLTPLLPNDEVSREMYLMAIKTLEAASLKQYEISAFARDGFISRHNSGYWMGRPFLGFGPSAFSYWEGKRFRNIANLSRYCQALEEKKSPVDYEEKLTPQASQREHFVLQLRLREGCFLDSFQKQYGELSEETWKIVHELIDSGLLQMNKDKTVLQLTQKGVLFYDTVATELI